MFVREKHRIKLCDRSGIKTQFQRKNETVKLPTIKKEFVHLFLN